MIRKSNIVDRLPEVVPPLLDITNLDPDIIRHYRVTSIPASYGVNADERLTAHVVLTHGITEVTTKEDIAYTGDLERFHTAMVSGDFRAAERRNLTFGLAALLRISEVTVPPDKSTRKILGANALYLTREAVDITLLGTQRNPTAYGDQVKIVSQHAESFETLLPYLRRPRRNEVAAQLSDSQH